MYAPAGYLVFVPTYSPLELFLRVEQHTGSPIRRWRIELTPIIKGTKYSKHEPLQTSPNLRGEKNSSIEFAGRRCGHRYVASRNRHLNNHLRLRPLPRRKKNHLRLRLRLPRRMVCPR